MVERRGATRRELDKELEQMSAKALETATAAINAWSTHEKVCTQRYEQLSRTVNALVKLLVGVAVGMLGGMGLIIVDILLGHH